MLVAWWLGKVMTQTRGIQFGMTQRGKRGINTPLAGPSLPISPSLLYLSNTSSTYPTHLLLQHVFGLVYPSRYVLLVVLACLGGQ